MSALLPRIGILLCGLALGACSFAAVEEEAPARDVNACATDDDCSGDGHCQAGMCVASSALEPLVVMLEVSPVRMPDGSNSLPIVLPRFRVEGALERTWELPLPVTISGRVENAGEPLEAQLRFMPVEGVPRVPRKTVTASTTEVPQGAPEDADYSVRLLSGVEYRMLVQPDDSALPPFERFFTARGGMRVDIDYDDFSMRQQTFAFSGVPSDRTLAVRAFSRDTGEPISSVATMEDGRATLLFSPGAAPFRLEVTADQVYESPDGNTGSNAGTGGICDTETPSFPVLSVLDDDIDSGQVGIVELALPTTPQRIRFEGTVELCPGAEGADVESLPVSLRSTSILFGEEAEPSPFTGSVSVTTEANLDTDNRQLRFCVETMPGDYEVVVTPPASVECAIFAEPRLVKAPPDGVASTGALLALPRPAYLSGRLRTGDGEPMAGALIEAVALGRRDGLELAEDDSALTRYNRSSQAASDEDGAFHLPVDLGSYDVMVKPVAGSGFAWTVRHDVDIAARDIDFATLIDVGFPLPIEGQLAYADGLERDDATLDGAEVRAFAILEDSDGSERSIAIGKAIADADGAFTMLVSPSLRRGW